MSSERSAHSAKAKQKAKRYWRSKKRLQAAFNRADAVLSGWWLSGMDEDDRRAIDEQYYSGQAKYHDGDYNRGGLWEWETKLLDRYFTDVKTILVGSVGGGRELFGLEARGYEADGFECHPELVAFANRTLEAEGMRARVVQTKADECPAGGADYDGLIAGWGGYMLIRTRAKRVEFLRKMRARAKPGAPIMLSFYGRSDTGRNFALAAKSAQLFKRFRRNAVAAEEGDYMSPTYSHYFTEEELREELDEAGFDLVYYSEEDYGHAVGIAR